MRPNLSFENIAAVLAALGDERPRRLRRRDAAAGPRERGGARARPRPRPRARLVLGRPAAEPARGARRRSGGPARRARRRPPTTAAAAATPAADDAGRASRPRGQRGAAPRHGGRDAGSGEAAREEEAATPRGRGELRRRHVRREHQAEDLCDPRGPRASASACAGSSSTSWSTRSRPATSAPRDRLPRGLAGELHAPRRAPPRGARLAGRALPAPHPRPDDVARRRRPARRRLPARPRARSSATLGSPWHSDHLCFGAVDGSRAARSLAVSLQARPRVDARRRPHPRARRTRSAYRWRSRTSATTGTRARRDGRGRVPRARLRGGRLRADARREQRLRELR